MHDFVCKYQYFEIDYVCHRQPVKLLYQGPGTVSTWTGRINMAAELCIRCRRAMLTTDVPYKSVLQKSSRDVMMALTTHSFVGLGKKRLI